MIAQPHPQAMADDNRYVEVSYEEAVEKLNKGEWTHASHAMIYAPWPGALFDKYEHKYAVMVSLLHTSTI